jgi:predicted glycosyltransferase
VRSRDERDLSTTSHGGFVNRQSARVAIFTHDTFGLGHVRRCLHITRGLAERDPRCSVLIVTGSPAMPMFADLPANADVVKVPVIAKTGAKHLRPSHVKLPLPELAALRQRLIREAVLGFAPDVFVVDNFPLGAQGELAPILQELRGLPTRTVLGLRDIVDAPEAVRADWERQGVYDVLDRYYDRILVYGMRGVLDVAEAYGLSPRAAGKVRYCGYVTDGDAAAAPDVARPGLELEKPFLLATGGGGGDAFPLLDVFLDALPFLPDLPALVVTGPLMSATQRAALQAKANGRGGVTIVPWVPSLRPYIAAAAAVVAMCGYNTAAEIVSLRAPAVLVPRTWRYGEHLRGKAAGEEAEQRLRAEALAALGLARVVMPGDLSPERLAERVREQLDQSGVCASGTLDVDGLPVVVDHILALAGGESGGNDVAA